MLFATNAAGRPSAASKIGGRVLLFGITGCAKNAPNAVHKLPLAPAGTVSFDIGSVLAGPSTARVQGGDELMMKT